MPAKGSYLLLVRLSKAQRITVGSLGVVPFRRGYYAYVGSALGGFKSRLNRHLRKDKTPKWHIDYLLQKGDIRSIIISETSVRVECAIARTLSLKFESVTRFGSRDCKCAGHLFFAAEEKQLREGIMTTLTSLSLNRRKIQ